MVREALTIETLRALEPREAASLFIARRAEGLTANERQLLESWLAGDANHREMFESAERAWQSFGDAGDDEILAAMRVHARMSRRRFAATWRPMFAAAAVLVLVIAAALMYPALNPFAPAAPTAGLDLVVEYVSARGEVKEIKLPDGSGMTLDAESEAAVRLGDSQRTVELRRGRAFFVVEHDASRPFSVKAGGRTIVALGTRFDVNLLPDGLTVTLLEGQVSVASATGKAGLVTLKPGQQYLLRDDEAAVFDVGAAGKNVVAWRTGLVSFADQPLYEAVAVMNRYSQEQIAIGDDTVGRLRVSGQFRAGETQRFAATVAELHRLRVEHQPGRLDLVRAE